MISGHYIKIHHLKSSGVKFDYAEKRPGLQSYEERHGMGGGIDKRTVKTYYAY